MYKKIRNALKLVPFGLFALYSVLLFAFFGGGVYKTDFDIFETPKSVYAISDVSDMIDGIKASLVFLVIFLIVSLALSALMALNLFYPKLKNKVVSFKGKFYLPLTYVLQGAAYALYFIFLVISAVIMGKVSAADEGLGLIKAGAAPKLILSFAIIFAAFSAAANVVSFLAARKFPEIAANEKKELEIAIENKKKAAERKKESVAAESEKFVGNVTLLRGKPVLKRVNSYMRMRRVLKGMGIAFMVSVLFFVGACIYSEFYMYIYNDISPTDYCYILLTIIGVTVFIGLLCLLGRAHDWSPSELKYGAGKGTGHKGSFGFWCISTIATAVTFVIFVCSIGSSYSAAYLCLSRAIASAILLIISILGMIAAKICKKNYCALCLHFYGTTKTYADSEAIREYNSETEMELLAAYRGSKSSVADCADNRETKSPVVRVAFACLFAVVAILGFILYPTAIISPFNRSYVSLVDFVGAPVNSDFIESTFGKQPHEISGDGQFVYYYSKNYRKIAKQLSDLEEQFENAALSDNMDKLDSLMNKIDALETKAENTKHTYLCITIDKRDYGSQVSSVVLDKNFVQSRENTRKTIKKLKISKTSIQFKSELSQLKMQCYYTDGSYKSEYIPAYAFADIDFTQKGYQTIKWEDDWGEYSTRIQVK